MSQEFVPDENDFDCPNSEPAAVSEQDVLLVTLVGSPQGVRETILTLYRLGFAQVGDWSPPTARGKSEAGDECADSPESAID